MTAAPTLQGRPRYPTPRTPGGRVRWTPTLQGRVRDWLLKGISYGEIAEHLRVKVNTLHQAVATYDLDALPEHWLDMPALLELLGGTETNVRHILRNNGIPYVLIGGYRLAVPADHVPKVLELPHASVTRLTPQQAQVAGYRTAEQYALTWGMASDSVRNRLSGLPFVLVTGGRSKPARAYHLRDAEPFARPPRLRRPPAGCMTISELAELTDRCAQVVERWKLPQAGVLRCGRQYFRLSAVAEHLESTARRSYKREAAATIRQHLAGQGRRAA